MTAPTPDAADEREAVLAVLIEHDGWGGLGRGVIECEGCGWRSESLGPEWNGRKHERHLAHVADRIVALGEQRGDLILRMTEGARDEWRRVAEELEAERDEVSGYWQGKYADALRQIERAEADLAAAEQRALYAARDALYRGEGPDLVADSDIVYGEWLGNRADRLGTQADEEA